jgi:hypothetical protein
VEQVGEEGILTALEHLKSQKNLRPEEDFWVFSSAEDISSVLETVEIVKSNDEIDKEVMWAYGKRSIL